MSAGIYNITIEQGADWRLLFVWKDTAGEPHDLTEYTARMQVRASFDAKTPIFNLTTENGGIYLGGIEGTVDVNIAAAVTQGVKVNRNELSWQDGKEGMTFAYDLEMIDGEGRVKRLLQGAVFFIPEVTR